MVCSPNTGMSSRTKPPPRSRKAGCRCSATVSPHRPDTFGAGAELTLIDRTLTDPGPGTVRVAVEACGICHTDSVFVDDQWPGLQFPVTPGHEIAGHIDAIGEGVEGWREGERVAIGLRADIAGIVAAVGAVSSFTARSAWSPAQHFPADTPNTWWLPRARWPVFPTNCRPLTPRRSRARG